MQVSAGSRGGVALRSAGVHARDGSPLRRLARPRRHAAPLCAIVPAGAPANAPAQWREKSLSRFPRARALAAPRTDFVPQLCSSPPRRGRSELYPAPKFLLAHLHLLHEQSIVRARSARLIKKEAPALGACHIIFYCPDFGTFTRISRNQQDYDHLCRKPRTLPTFHR